MRISWGFTIVELLVVITIIAILLALLMPSLDRAVYEAELAVCGANLKAVAAGVATYATASVRQYPVRDGARLASDWYPSELYSGYDDRVTIGKALNIQGVLNDPAAGKVDLTRQSTYVFTSYSLWFGWRFRPAGGMERGMFKLGQSWTWAGNDYNLIASDHDRVDTNPAHLGALASHPDDGPFMDHVVFEDATYTLARWQVLYALRAPLTLNFAYDDGSVRRGNGVQAVDERMAKVPDRSDALYPDYWWHTVPTH